MLFIIPKKSAGKLKRKQQIANLKMKLAIAGVVLVLLIIIIIIISVTSGGSEK